MSDLEDERSANLAPVNGLSDNIIDYDDSNLGLDPSHFSKFGDPHSPTYDPFSSPPSSEMAHKDYDSSAHQYEQYDDEAEVPQANESRDYGHLTDNLKEDDLPANFAKEAARHQNVSESDNFEDDQSYDLEDEETEEDAQRSTGSDQYTPDAVSKGSDQYTPDAVSKGSDQYTPDAVSKGNGGSYDNSDRPIMGYNPFLNEVQRDKEEDQQIERLQEEEGRQEEEGHYYDREYDGTVEDEHKVKSYNRLDDDENEDSGFTAGHVDDTQHGYDDVADDRAGHEEEEPVEEGTEADGSIHGREYSEDTQGLEQYESQYESNSRPARESGEFDSRHFDDGFDTRGGQGHVDGYQYPGSQQPDIDFESVGVYDYEHREDAENVPPQTSQAHDDDLGIVNQGFSDDVDLEGEKIIPEEEIVESEEPLTKAANVTDAYEGEEEEAEEQSRRDEGEAGVGYGDEFVRDEDYDEDKVSPQEEEKLRRDVEEKEDYTKETEQITSREEDYVHEQERFEDEESEPISETKEDYTRESLRMSEEMERSTIVEGGHFQDIATYGDADSVEDKELTSHFAESDLLSKDRSFVDNLSDVTSPETIPQPLPSPPEPRNLSSIEPQAALDSASYRGPDEENVGQHSSLFQQTAGLDESNTADFLTACEVEGETKFDVDGTAITSTTQNNAFLHSDEEEDDEDEDEEEEESQHLDQGLTTGTTETETETSVDGEFGAQQMTANDNALMSMSMEGSFYDDGGELIGGDDRRNQDNLLYEGGVSVGDEISEHDGFQPKQENFLDDHSVGLGQEVQNNLVDEQESNQVSDDFHSRRGEDEFHKEVVEDEFDKEGGEDEFDKEGGEDEFESHHVEPDHRESDVNGGVFEEEAKPSELDSLIGVQSPEPALQSQTVDHYEAADSSVDNAGVDFTAESESSVDFQQPHLYEQLSPKDVDEVHIPDVAAEQLSPKDVDEVHIPDLAAEQLSPKDVDEVHIPDVAAAKPEEPASSVDESPAADKEETSGVALGAAAATAAGVTVAAAAAASAAITAKATTTTVKKTSAKAGGKTTTTTTTTTTKVTKETKTTNGKAPPTKKTEITTTTATKTTPRKPATESRPTSAATSEKKTPVKAATSPTKPPSAPASAKGPVPSATQRKPKDPKPATTTTEEKKKPTATTTTATISRTSVATHRSPRPQSTTAAASSTTTSATSSITTATKTTTKTTVSTTATSRTPLSSRPKSSPAKLTNGTAAAPSDTKSPTKRSGTDSKSEGHKPASGNVKVATEKKEVKTKVETVTKSSTQGATPTRSPTKTTTPRPPSTPKTGEVKSRVGSMDNATHTPGGGNVRIASKKPDFTNVTSKIGSKDKIDHKPGGGNVKIESKKVKVEAKSKVGSLNNATHKPGGGDKKVETRQLEWKVESKIGSLNNAEHVAGGGDKKIETKKLDWKVDSKVGSLDNAQHKAGGGDKKIDTQKLDWKVNSKVGSLDNSQHKAGGGDKKIEVQKTEWKAQSKIGSLDNVKHKPGGVVDKQGDSQKSKTESIDKAAPGSGSEQGASEVQNGAASEN